MAVRNSLADFYFRIDLRSLGLFRILAGWLLIQDWFSRWPELEAFYTSFGVVPIEAPLPKPGGEFHVGLLDGAVSLPVVRFWFLVGLIFYTAFLIGYRTKIFQTLSLVFFASALNRSFFTAGYGERLLLTFLVFSLFLPLGSRFSLDLVLKRLRKGFQAEEDRSAPSLAAFAVVFQIALVYALSAFNKWGDPWKEGTALVDLLHLSYYATPLGRWLVEHVPFTVLKTATRGIVVLEYAAPLFVLLPLLQPFLRRTAIAALSAMHVGIWVAMGISGFSLTMIASFSLLLLPADWERIEKFPGMRRLGHRVAGQRHEMPEGHDRSRFSAAPNFLTAILLTALLLENYNASLAQVTRTRIDEPLFIQALVRAPGLGFGWFTAAPTVLDHDVWWVMSGLTKEGKAVDPLTSAPPTWERPGSLTRQYDPFWRRYLYLLTFQANEEFRIFLAQYLWRRYNRGKPESQALVKMDGYLLRTRRWIPQTPQTPPKRILVLHYEGKEGLEP